MKKETVHRPAAKKPEVPKKSYAEREYGLTKAELVRAYKAIDKEIAAARAAADGLKLSRAERELQNSFGEELCSGGAQHRRLVAAVDARIDHYRRCRPLLRHVTADVFSAGRDIFTSEAVLAIWLCEPAKALDAATPISMMRQAKGRARVIELLHAIAHGVYL